MTNLKIPAIDVINAKYKFDIHDDEKTFIQRLQRITKKAQFTSAVKGHEIYASISQAINVFSPNN